MSDPQRDSDRFAQTICRESDRITGPMGRTLHILLILFLVAGGGWVTLGIRDLRAASDRCESELLEFRELAEQARRAPRRDLPQAVERLRRRIREQSWPDNLDGVRPRVLQTPVGLRVRFARTVPTLEER